MTRKRVTARIMTRKLVTARIMSRKRETARRRHVTPKRIRQVAKRAGCRRVCVCGCVCVCVRARAVRPSGPDTHPPSGPPQVVRFSIPSLVRNPSLTLTHSHSPSLTLAHSHSLSLTLTHSHSPSLSLTLTHPHSLSLTHWLSLARTLPSPPLTLYR